MIQWIIVAIIIALALLWLCRRLIRSHRSAGADCNCCDARCPMRKPRK